MLPIIDNHGALWIETREGTMRKRNGTDRRRLMIRAAEVAGAALMLGGCDRFVGNDTTKTILASAERLTARVQRLVSPAQLLAREYTETDLSPAFRANDTVDPDDEDYQEQSAKGFADWSLDLGGLVECPAKFSLADLRALRRARKSLATTAWKAGAVLENGKVCLSAK